MLPNATKYFETSDVKDALSAVYEVGFCFVLGHMTYITRIENTFWVTFGPRGCSGVLYLF